VGKHVGEDTTISRSNETLGVVVVETGSGHVGGVPYQTLLGADTVQGIGNSPPYSYTLSGFSYVPKIAIATQEAMDDADGSWAYIYGSSPMTITSVKLAVDEDEIGDTDRSHATEQVGVLVFQDVCAAPLTAQ
jgi:hypothetical protein